MKRTGGQKPSIMETVSVIKKAPAGIRPIVRANISKDADGTRGKPWRTTASKDLGLMMGMFGWTWKYIIFGNIRGPTPKT